MENIAPALLDWFYQNKRILPFRTDPSPYHVWVSEIMLQQTRVEAVKGYYARFLAELPDIPSLAACDPDRLHKLWSTLGVDDSGEFQQEFTVRLILEYYLGKQGPRALK